MDIPITDEELLAALDVAREKNPELAQTIDLHSEVISARSKVEATPKDRKADKQEVAELVDRREPMLSRWQLEWDPNAFASLAAEVCDIGARHRPELAPSFEEVRSLLIGDPGQSRDIVVTYLREGRRGLPDLTGETSEVLSFVLIHALYPFFRAYASILIPLIDDHKWYQRLCPVCGEEPDFAYLEETVGGLRALCSRCDTLWMYRRGECTFCGNSNNETFAYYLSDDNVYRLYVCDDCQRYLKVMDGRETSLEPVLPVQRIISIGMDLAARQEGYR